MEDNNTGLDGSGRSGKSGGRSTRSKRAQQNQLLSPPIDPLDLSNRSKSSSISRSKQQQQQHGETNIKQQQRPSSIGSSSAGSRRRAKEKANQLQKKELLKQQRRGSRDYHIDNDNGSTASASRSDRITTIMEVVGGGDFVEELASPILNNAKNVNSAARYSNQSQQHQQQQRRPSLQQQLQQQQSRSPNTNNNNIKKQVVHACDDKGRCIFHPHIQLRKKAIMGVLGGWKDIRRFCPDCERQEIIQELIAKEANEIEQMERILDQMEQLDVEYLNDDTDHGINDDVVIDVANSNMSGGGDGSSYSSQRNTATTAGKGRGGLEPPGDISRRSSMSSKGSKSMERNPGRVEKMEEQRQQQQQQQQLLQEQQMLQQQRKRSSREQQQQKQQQKYQQQQQQQEIQQHPARKQTTEVPKDRNSNGQSRRRRTLSPKKDRNDNNNVGKRHALPNSPPPPSSVKKNRRSDNYDDDYSSSSYSSSSSYEREQLRKKQLKEKKNWKMMMKKKNKKSSNDAISLNISSYSSSSSSSSSSYEREQLRKKQLRKKQLKEKKSWKKMMKKNKNKESSKDAISSYISSGIPDTTARSQSPGPPTRPTPKRSDRRRGMKNNTPPPQRTLLDQRGNEDTNRSRSLTREKSIKLMKDVNKSVTKGVTGILRNGKKRSIEISHSVKKQISSSFNTGSSVDEFDLGEEDHSYYSSESYSSDSSDDAMSEGRNNSHESDRGDNNQYRKSDPVGYHGGIRAPRPVAVPPQPQSATAGVKDPPQKNGGGNNSAPARDLHRQVSVDSAATFTDLRRDKSEILDLHASLIQEPHTDGIRVYGGKADPISEHEALQTSLDDLELDNFDRRSSLASLARRKEIDSDSGLHDSSATFTDVKHEKGEIFDLHASITELKSFPRPESSTSLSEQKGMDSSFNDSSATYTDTQQEKGEIVDLHASIVELNGGKGYENLRKSFTQCEIDDLHASLTELTGASYNEKVLKQATNAAANSGGFNDSSATFTDHSRDRGDIVDMHASFTQLQGPSNLLQQIDSENSSETYTDYESDMDEMQSLHASFTQLRGPLGSADSSASSSVDDNASFTDICLKKIRKPDSHSAELDDADDNASFTDICLNMIRKPDSGAAELFGSEEDIDDDASFTDICINMLLRKSDSDTKQQRFRAMKRRSLSVDASDDDFDIAFDSDRFSYQNDNLQVPPKPSKKSSTKNAARRRAERWEQARKVFSAKIEEERMKAEEGIEYPKKTDNLKPLRRVSFSEIVDELRPQQSKSPNDMTEEDKTRLRAELWKQARELFSEQIAEEERITKEKLKKQLLAEKAQTLDEPSESFEPKMEEQSSSDVDEQQQATKANHDATPSMSFEPKIQEQSSTDMGKQQQTTETNHEATPVATLPEQRIEASSTEQSLSEQGSEQLEESDVAADISSFEVPTIDRLDSERTDATGISSLDERVGSDEDPDEMDDTDDQAEQLDYVTKAEPKTFEVTHLPYTGDFGESGMYTGTVNEKYQPSGKGIMMYDNGEELKGHWKNGVFLRESELYSDSEEEDDDDEEEDEEDDLNSSMADVGAKRDRSRSRSKSKDRHVAKSPPRPTFNIGDTGKKSDMITDKDAAIAVIEKLTFGEGAFIRRSDGNWTYAEVKSFEETPEGRSSIRFIVNQKNSSKSYAKKYWKTHIRPLNIAPKKHSSSSVERTGRGRNAVDNINSSSTDQSNRGISCPPATQSRLSFDWPNRRGRSRSRSLHRAVSASPMRALHSISELAKEEEAGEE